MLSSSINAKEIFALCLFIEKVVVSSASRRTQTPLPNTLHIMSRYLTNMNFATIITSICEQCGVIDEDIVSISVGSHDVTLHLMNTPASTAFMSESIKQFGLKLTSVSSHITDGTSFITTQFEAKTHMGPVKVSFTLSESE